MCVCVCAWEGVREGVHEREREREIQRERYRERDINKGRSRRRIAVALRIGGGVAYYYLPRIAPSIVRGSIITIRSQSTRGRSADG